MHIKRLPACTQQQRRRRTRCAAARTREAAGRGADERDLHRVGVAPQRLCGCLAQLLVCHKLDGVKRQVTQQEGAVSGVQAAQPLLGQDGAHLQW